MCLYWSFFPLSLVPKIVPSLKSGSEFHLHWVCCHQTDNSCILACTKSISAHRPFSGSVCIAYVHLSQQPALLEFVQKTCQRQCCRHAIFNSLSEEKDWLLLGGCVKRPFHAILSYARHDTVIS